MTCSKSGSIDPNQYTPVNIMYMLAISAFSESVSNTFATCFYITDNEVQPVQQLSSGNCLAWYLRLRNSPIALCLSAAAAGRPVCSAPRANSHQLIRCSLKKPVHTHLATLMDWSVFTFSQHLGVRVTAWPNLSHLEHMSPGASALKQLCRNSQ